jgi:beta-lactamase regulating signal transducer with metallopeptidase domain
MLKNRSPKLQKMVALTGLIKLFIPPFSIFNGVKPELLSAIPAINTGSFDVIFAASKPESSFLNSYSILMILWMFLSIAFIVVIFFNIYFSISKIKRADKTKQILLPNTTSIKNLTIIKSKDIESPYIIGLWHSYLFLPQSWDRWDKTVRNSVIAHETAHIKEGDQWINLFKIMALLVHFFNPFVWILIKKISYFSEVICDDYSIAHNHMHPIDYNKHLVAIAQGGRNDWAYSPVLSFSSVHKMIKNRMYYQLTRKEGSILKKISLKTKIVVIFSALLMLLFSLQCTNTELPTKSEPDNVQKTLVNGVYNFFDVDEKPIILEKAIPVFPSEAKEKGLSGTVVVNVVIDENGHVSQAMIPKALPSRKDHSEKIVYKPTKEFVQPALDAAKKCTFKPATKDGKPVKVSMYIPYRFMLRKKM